MLRVVTLLLAAGAVAAQTGEPSGRKPVAPPDGVDTRRLVGQSDQTAKRLGEADRLLAAGKPADALDLLLKLQAEAGDDLVSADGRTFRPARRVAQQVLVRLPPAVLRAYRDRVDGPAKQLLAAGTRDRDPRPLRTLLDRYFPAAAAEPALLLLGELLFERGEFRQAEACWRRLLPAEELDGDPSVPDPKADPAAVRARVALSVIFQGDTARAREAVETLRKSHPTAAGRLAGADGLYVKTLTDLLGRRPAPPAPAGGGEWTGFAGSASRDGRATGRLPKYWPSRPTWQARLPAAPGDRAALLPTPTARSVPYHPVVLDGVGYLADPLRVYAFDPLAGTPRVAFDLRSQPQFQALRLEPESAAQTADADFTLTAADGRLFARLGQFPAPAAADPDKDGPTSLLVCLAPDGAGDGRLALRWALPPPAPDGSAAAWEAAPVWRDGRVYAAFTRLDGTTRTYAVAAYADPPGPRPLWVADVAAAPGDGPRVRQEPLTVAGDLLVYCTHAGSVVALDPATGKPDWAVKYPPLPPPDRRPSRPPPARDLCPPLAAGGRVFVAPHDSDRLMALDAAAGRELWAVDGLQVDQLLGVSRNRLVVTLAGPQRGVRGLDAATGNDREPAGWRTHDDPALASFGRGLVTDDLILWPTRQGLFLLDPGTGRPVAQPLPGPHGNLSFADGVLLVGTPTGVAGYVPAGRLPDGEPRRRAVALLEAGRRDEAVALVHAAGLPDARRLAAWWADPLPATVATAAAVPLRVEPPAEPSYLCDPTSLTTVGPDAAVSHVTRFPAPVLPLRPFADAARLPGLDGRDPLLLVTDGRRVLAYRPGLDRPAWATPLPDGLVVARAEVIGQAVLAAGPAAVVRLDRSDGRLVWAYRPPDPPPGPRPATPPLSPRLTDFVLLGDRLCCRLGRHHLLALDLATGRLTWARDGLFRRFEPFPFPSAPGFTHLAAPDGLRLLARRTDGRLLVLDPAGGDLLSAQQTAAVPWDGPPPRVGLQQVALADGPDEVNALDLRTRRRAWQAAVGGEFASLTGRPPQLKVIAGGLLIAVARTHGVELEYVRRADGGRWRGWPDEPVFVPGGAVDLPAADADEATVYIPGERELFAVRLADGYPLWRAPLPGPGRWRVRAGARAVVLTPDAPVPAEPFADVLARVVSRFLCRPHAGKLPAVLLGLYDAGVGGTVPVVRLDLATGNLLGRLDLPAAGPVVGVHLGPGPAVAVAGTAAHWLN